MHENAPQNIWTLIIHQDIMNIMLFYNISKPHPILDILKKEVEWSASFLVILFALFSSFIDN